MMTPGEGQMTDALSRGESVPGGPGACAGCGHLTPWHGHHGRYKAKPCQLCDCRAFTRQAAGPPGTPRQQRRRPRLSSASAAEVPPVAELALFSLEEVS